MSCNVSIYFSRNNLDTSGSVSSQLRTLVKQRLNEGKTKPKEQLKSFVYDRMIEWLDKEQGMFQFPAKTSRGADNIVELQQFIIDQLNLFKSIKLKRGKEAEARIIDDVIKQFSGKNFQIAGGIKEENVVEIEETPEQTTKESVKTEEDKEWIGISNIQKKVFGKSLSARLYRQTLFERDLTRTLIVDVDQGTITRDNNDLNVNIGKLKNLYYKQIVKFMRTIHPENNYPEDMYIKDGVLVSNYEWALNDFLEYLQNKQKENKELFDSEINQGWRNAITTDGQAINSLFGAASAYINLQYFDSLLNATIGKVVSIEADLRGVEVDINYMKYAFGTSLNNMAKGWETSENRNALEEMGRFSKLLIQSIPMFERRSGKSLHTNISLVGFTNAFTNLFAAAVQAKSNGEDSALLDDIVNTHGDPGILIPKILNTLFSSKGISLTRILLRNGLNNFDLNVLYSVRKYCFKSPNKGLNDKSIETIEHEFNPKKYSLIDCILGAIDRVTQVDYLETVTQSNNTTDVNIKTKFHSRQKEYNLRNGINKQISNRSLESRKVLIDKYKITPVIPGGTQDYSITIGNNTYIVSILKSARNKGGIFGTSLEHISIKNAATGSSVNFNQLVNLGSTEAVDKLLKKSNLSDTEQQFLDVLQFIQDQTQLLNLTSQQGLDKLLILENLLDNSVSHLMLAAVKCALANQLYYDYANLKNPTQTFEEYVLDQQPLLNDLSPNEKIYYFSQGLGTKDFTPIKISDDWVSNYALAEAILSGEVSRAVTKDIFGNSISNYSTAYLGANLIYYFSKYKKDKTAAASNLFFATRPEFIGGAPVNFDFQNRAGDKKNVKKLSVGELLYTHIVDSFWGLQIGETTNRNRKLKGKWLIQPTTYADKTKVVEYIINPDRKIQSSRTDRSYVGKTLRELSSDETILLYSDTIGNYYRQSFSDQVKKYYELFPELGAYTPTFIIYDKGTTNYKAQLANQQIEAISALLDKLNNLSSEELNVRAQVDDLGKVKNVEDYLNKLAQKRKIYNFQLDTTYRVDKSGKVQFNELLDYYANYLYNEKNLKTKLNKERVNFLNDLLSENVSFYTKYLDSQEGVTKIASIIEYLFTSKEGKLDKEGVNKYYKEWTKEGRLILAKQTVNGETIDILQGTPLPSDAQIVLNPLLEEYFIKDSFISNSLRLSLTGSEIAHMSKVQIRMSPVDRLKNTKGYQTLMGEEECAAQGAQLKRNVIIPATLQYMTQNTPIGVPKQFKVAVIRDIKAPVNNFRGDNRTIDAQDGSAKILPFTAILENNSLQDQAVGQDRKPIWHHFDPTTGTATLLKFATNTITNERMQQSLDSDLNLYHLFKKMTHLRWHRPDGTISQDLFSKEVNNIDLTNVSYTNTKFNFQRDILKGSHLFYQEGFETREIVGFGKELIGDKEVYYTEEYPSRLIIEKIHHTTDQPIRVYQLFDENGTAHKVTKEELESLGDLSAYHTIDSLFELHQALGGIYSVDHQGNQFVQSETSNYAVVAFMNFVSIRQTDEVKNFRQSTFYQPLKDAMIAYASNNSAVKNGVSNINQASAWTDDSELTYMLLDTDGLGIQLDPDHDIEEAHMTEFSQVIAALEAGGRLHEIADLTYQDLGRVALTTAKVELDALKHLTTDRSKSELYDVIGRTIINNIKNNRTADLSQEILDALQGKNFNIHDNHIRDAIKIPFSDPNIYSQLLPTFVSTLNSKSVKRKYPGSGCVMVPGYGTIQLYYIDGIPHQFQDVAKKALVALSKENPKEAGETFYNYQRRLVKQYLETLQLQEPLKDIGEFIPTDVVNVSWTQADGRIRTKTIVLDSMDKYVQFKLSRFTLKNLIISGNDTEGNPISLEDLKDVEFTFQQNVTKGRDLAPARIWWEQNGKIHNVFDRPEIKRNFTDTVTYQILVNRKKVTKTVQVPKSWSKEIRTPEGIMKYLGDLAIEGTIQIDSSKSSRADIQKVFDNLAEGFVEEPDGTIIQVQNIHNEAAQIVMSNVFKQRFGESGSLVETLDKIKDETAFYNKKINPIRANFDFDLVLVDSTNRHSFITFNEEVPTGDRYDPKVSYWDQNYIKRIPIRGERGGISRKQGNYVYTIDRSNNLQYLIGKEIVTDLNWEDIKDSKEVAEGKYRLDANNRVVEYIEYITRYRAVNVKKNGGSTAHTLYQINVKNLERTGEYELLPKLVSTLYNQGNFAELRINTKLSTKNLKTITDALPNGSSNLYPLEVSQHLNEVKQKFIVNVYDKLIAENKSQLLINWDTYKETIDRYRKVRSKILRSSFLRSLEVTASRIPAQTLQSFMQMQIAGFVNSDKNLCYVSHFQTYLQGSDYDIDKAYIMMSEIDKNGQYIGWSPLFNYSSIEYLKASEMLPTPAGNTFKYSEDSEVDISEDIRKIKNSVGPDKLIAEASLIQKLDKIAQRKNTNELGVTIDLSIFDQTELEAIITQTELKKVNKQLRQANKEITPENQKKLLSKITISQDELLTTAVERALYRVNLHENYEIPIELRESAYKNSVSSKINRIIQDLRNMDSAYSSVDEEMDTLRAIAENSPKGNLTKRMSLANPATKFQMQVQNMIGKDVIGISASGEKIYFNLNYYWNEGIRSGDETWMKYLKFQHNYSRIQGRASGNPEERIIDSVANLNMDISDPLVLKDKLNEMNVIIKEVDNDFLNKGIMIPRESSEYQQALRAKIKEHHANVSQADIQISALLSAATDNAKELILARINGGSNLAGNYLYLLSIGFSIDDIAAFMISPSITILSSFLNENMYDGYSIKLSAFQLNNLLLGIIPGHILTGRISNTDIETGRTSSMSLSQYTIGSIQNALGIEEAEGPEILQTYFRRRVLGEETRTIKDIVGSISDKFDYQINIFSNYVDNIISKISYEFNKSRTPLDEQWLDYIADLEEFSKVQIRASEATSLGTTFLALNQGLPTSETDLLNKLKQMNSIVDGREKNIRVKSDKGNITLKDAIRRYKEETDSEKKDALYTAIITALVEHNSKLTEDEIRAAFDNAQDIAGGEFNIRKWINDMKYREITKEYYNIIKETWNVFDVIDKVPHYKALMELFSLIYNTNNQLSIKSKVIDLIHTSLLKSNETLDDYMLKQLEHFVDDRFIVNWIKKGSNTNFTIPIASGQTYLSMDFDEVSAPTDLIINLKDATGISNFKYFVEKYLIPQLQGNGVYDRLTSNPIIVNTNPFIQNLIYTEDNRGVPFYKLDIDMLTINDSPENQYKFQTFIDGLMELNGINYYGHSLADWFIMYNFIVNKNNFGQDRMTTIFKPFLQLNSEDNLLRQYYKYISELDYIGTSRDLKDLGIYLEDAKMYIAPYKTEFQERRAENSYIKQSKNGFTIYKKLIDRGNYQEIPLIPERTLTNKGKSELEQNMRLRNQAQYGVLQSPVVNSVEYYRLGLDSDDLDTILNTLAVLTSKGNLLYVIENCD